MNWAYGITTVPARLSSYFPKTLGSLARAGFPNPRVFLDGSEGILLETLEGCEITQRRTPVRAYGSWLLAALELYLREPNAHRYALFQDDLIAVRNLRDYLEKTAINKAYLNLYTIPANDLVDQPGLRGWVPSPRQDGKGALALVFDNEGMRLLLANQHMIDRATDKERGHKSIDGGVLTAMANVGWKEYVHQPSLVQHTSVEESVIGNSIKKPSESFPGEDFDAMEFLRQCVSS